MAFLLVVYSSSRLLLSNTVVVDICAEELDPLDHTWCPGLIGTTGVMLRRAS